MILWSLVSRCLRNTDYFIFYTLDTSSFLLHVFLCYYIIPFASKSFVPLSPVNKTHTALKFSKPMRDNWIAPGSYKPSISSPTGHFPSSHFYKSCQGWSLETSVLRGVADRHRPAPHPMYTEAEYMWVYFNCIVGKSLKRETVSNPNLVFPTQFQNKEFHFSFVS